MIDNDSRYAALETAKYKKANGDEISYSGRRFLPPGKKLQLLTEEAVGQGDRLDQITARSLGDPLLFWRVCDANNAINPHELTEEPGATLRIPVPDFQ